MEHAGSATAADRLVIDFEDNRLLGSLFGQYDQNLARIEQGFGVTIISRGNRVSIEGPRDACHLAKDVLDQLYARINEGHGVETGDVDGAMRLAQAGLMPSAVRSKTNSISGNQLRITTRNRVIAPRSPRQAAYMAALNTADMVFGIGPAGTGKTYLAVAMGVQKLIKGEVDRIILSRPAVEAGESLGFLPGDMKEKVDPYLRPLYDALYDMLPAEQVEKRMANGQIEIAPLAFMRGRTLANAFAILDEAQNTTRMQMKMFLTRFGENSRMVIAGDPSQIDLANREPSGLKHAVELLGGTEGISMVRFQAEDVVRHPLVGRIVDAYDKEDADTRQPSTMAQARKRGDSALDTPGGHA